MRRIQPLTLAAMFIIVSLSGCFGATPSEETGPAGSDPTDSSSDPQASGTAGTNPPSNEPNAPPPNHPPIASLNASQLNGTVPFNVTFTLEGADPDGEAITWILDANGDNTTDANGESLPLDVKFDYTVHGTFNVTLTVSDGVHNTTATLVIVAKPGKPMSASATDPAGDTRLEYTDIRSVNVDLDATDLKIVLKVTDVWTYDSGPSPVVYTFNVNGRTFRVFSRYPTDTNPMTWDSGASAYMTAGTAKWDHTANTVTLKLPLAYLEGKLKAPYKAFVSTTIGVINSDLQNEDRCPATGTLDVG